MKENRDYQLKVRLTSSERDLLVEKAAAAGMNISEFVRVALYQFIGGNKNGK